MKTEETKEYIVTWNDLQEAKDKVFELLLKSFKDNQFFHGEVLTQSDVAYSEGIEVLSDIIHEGFQFNTEYKD